MSETPVERADDADVPRAQRLFDNPWLLLAIGMLVMLLFYTGWGLWEVVGLSRAPLP